MPVSIKVNSDQDGYATTQGVSAFQDAMANEDSPHVASLRRAGAVLMGRSNSPAFAYRRFTNNDLHGRTLNPWDSSRTPGGSSGGASSAVASGMAPIAGGNDIGGSVRYPAYAGRGLPALVPAVHGGIRLAMPMVHEVGDEGMQKAAEHYAVAADWWGEKPTLEQFTPIDPRQPVQSLSRPGSICIHKRTCPTNASDVEVGWKPRTT